MTTLYRIFGRLDERDKNGLGRVGIGLLYVGITDNYAQRMKQHAEKRWWDEVTKVTRQEFVDRLSAIAAERVAIKSEHPVYNKAFNPLPPTVAAAPIPKASKHAIRDPLLNLAAASEYLGVCTKTMRRYISTGALPASRVASSRTIRVRLSDLDALLKPIPTTGR